MGNTPITVTFHYRSAQGGPIQGHDVVMTQVGQTRTDRILEFQNDLTIRQCSDRYETADILRYSRGHQIKIPRNTTDITMPMLYSQIVYKNVQATMA